MFIDLLRHAAGDWFVLVSELNPVKYVIVKKVHITAVAGEHRNYVDVDRTTCHIKKAVMLHW